MPPAGEESDNTSAGRAESGFLPTVPAAPQNLSEDPGAVRGSVLCSVRSNIETSVVNGRRRAGRAIEVVSASLKTESSCELISRGEVRIARCCRAEMAG